MEVDSGSGKILEYWSPSNKGKNPGDKFSQAVKRLEEEKKKAQRNITSFQSELEEKKQKSREAFEKELRRIREEKDTSPPPRHFDLD